MPRNPCCCPRSAPTASSSPTARRAPRRATTPRRYDAAREELDIDFVLHGDGPASTWAEQAEAGQRLGIGAPAVRSWCPRASIGTC
ncbi:siderophore-interacting protein [Achromobacter insuavis]